MNRRRFLGMIAAGTAYSFTWRVTAAEARKFPGGVDPQPLNAAKALRGVDPRARIQTKIPLIRKGPKPFFNFGKDGSFTFFQVSDVQERGPLHPRSRAIFDKACQIWHPQLVVMTGDNVDCAHSRLVFESTILPIARMYTENQVPFALTMGNHDTQFWGEGWYQGAEQWALWSRAGGRYFVDYNEPDLPGTGSGVINICAHGDLAGRQPKFNLYLLDSGDYGPHGGYDGVNTPQIRWVAERLKDRVPSLFFQHIPVYEMDLDNGKGIFTGAGKQRRLVAGHAVGLFKEPPCPQEKHDWPQARYLADGKTLYQVWRDSGCMKGAYFGHDHTNTFDAVNDEGVRLGYCKSLTKNSYNDDNPGLRVFKIFENGTFFTDTVSERAPNGTGWFGHLSPRTV